MPTTMYDSVTAADIPTNAPMVAGYVTGRYAWRPADWNRFAATRKVTICTDPRLDIGDVLDCERGDATPAQCPAWVKMRQAGGLYRPTVYCEASAVLDVRAACANNGLRQGIEYDLWIAHYTGTPHQEDNAVATQYANPTTSGGHYDLSYVTDDQWPHRTPPGENEMPALAPVYRLINANGDHFWTADETEKKTLEANGWTSEGIAFYAVVEVVQNAG